MNDILKETVLSGTAKRLNQLNIPLCAKTGTVGNSNGNTDAYCVSYNNSYKISVWFGNYDGSLMNNSITGGTLPVSVSYDLWKCLSTFKELNDFESCASVQKLKIDKIAYDKNNIIRLADDLAPKRYIMEEYFRENFNIKEKSTAFSCPNIENTELLVNNNRIIVRLCLIENIDYIIYRSDKNKKIQIYDSKNSLNKSEYIDDNFNPNTTYTYYVLPYYFDGIYQHFGDEILLGKIKSPSIKLGDNMWIDDDL
jgi:penicillin-binding protein 1A/penicillin-binding protein 2A